MLMNTYLFFDGRCAEAFRFYEQLLGGQIEFMQKAGETPERDRLPPEQHDSIMHVRMRVGDQVLMGSDAPSPHFEKPQGFFVSLQIDEPAEAERIFNGLSEGAEVRMPLQKTFWAGRFGMLVDRFGTPWMVNCEKGD
ncbi:MAG TPA: VOC family protein [Longimicrobium sp.]|jgi:PhnB protein